MDSGGHNGGSQGIPQGQSYRDDGGYRKTLQSAEITNKSFAFLCILFKIKLDRGSIRSSLRDGWITPYRLSKLQCLTVTPCPYPQWGPAFGPSCNEFVYHGLDAGILIMVQQVRLNINIEHGGLPHVLPLTVHLGYFFGGQVEGTILRCSYSLSFVVGPLLHV